MQTRRLGYTQFTKGTLALFAYNPADSEEIWRGVVRTAMDSATPPEAQVERLDRAIKTILDQVPSLKTGRQTAGHLGRIRFHPYDLGTWARATARTQPPVCPGAIRCA